MNKKIIPALLLILLLLINIYSEKVEATYYLELGERMLKKGDEGADVAILQSKLKQLSLYNGRIDGLYGQGTVNAVRDLQRKNNLSVDGIAGENTINKLPVNNSLISRTDISRDDIILLARIIHGEARGENFTGKVAVGAVILNRVDSSKFPNTIREVILQKGQFSCLNDGQANYYPTKSSIEAAKAALLGYDPTYGSLFFYNPDVATNLTWIANRPVVKRIGEHIFAR